MALALAGSGHRRTRPVAIVSFLNRGFVRVCGSPEIASGNGAKAFAVNRILIAARTAERPVVFEISMKSCPAAEVWERAAIELCRLLKCFNVRSTLLFTGVMVANKC